MISAGAPNLSSVGALHFMIDRFLFPNCELLESVRATLPNPARRSAAALVLLLAIVFPSGCKKSPPPPADPAKAPWLLDPQSQIKGLKDDDFRVRGLSAFNLGNMGAKAAEAIPMLEKLSRDDPNDKVRENAREAVGRIQGAPANVTQ